MVGKYVLAWPLLTVVAIANGTIRVTTYGNVMGELAAHQLSSLTGMILFGLCIWYLTRRWPLRSAGEAWIVGLAWLLMTVAFEFLFGHYVMGHPWSRLLHDYDLLEGRVWALVLAWITVAPYVFYRLGSSSVSCRCA